MQELKDALSQSPKQVDYDRQMNKIEELEKSLADREKPEAVARFTLPYCWHSNCLFQRLVIAFVGGCKLLSRN